ncbi:MAG: ATP phosphoribosyltransferase regulatory subunit [Malacoplasma sp.]|nr:ATP phosphoribosyltransferase regulatory subunit [Malacoplasma sp.]
MIIQKPRGTYDIYDKEYNLFEKINETFNIVSRVYNFKAIVTPIFELKDLFVRNIGSTTDIVTKEFYDFIDKGGREIALRPEGTVSVIRSVVENKLYATNPLPLKLSYFGPMFRYERPQSGRNRQFWQLGAEFIGIKTIEDQVEAILMCRTLLSSLGIEKWELNINYIGGNESRKKWIDSLKSYFSKYVNELSDDSKSRINKNPLRILDDKVDGEKDFVKNAIKIS